MNVLLHRWKQKAPTNPSRCPRQEYLGKVVPCPHVLELLSPAQVNTEVYSAPLQRDSQLSPVARALTSCMSSASTLLQPLSHTYSSADASTYPFFSSGHNKISAYIIWGDQHCQDIDSWITCIELLIRPAIDDAFICMARGRLWGYA